MDRINKLNAGRWSSPCPFPEVAARLARDPAEAERMAQAHQAAQRARRDAYEALEWDRLEEHLVAHGALDEDAALVARAALGGEPLRFETALAEACAWWASNKPFLALLGQSDAGKTIAGVALMSLCRTEVLGDLDVGDTWAWDDLVLYVLASEIAGMGTLGESAEAQKNRLKTASLLLIDELGSETETGPWLTNLNELVNIRKGSGLRTVLISNLSWEVFAKRYGDRIARRVKQAGHRYVFGPDDRLSPGGKP